MTATDHRRATAERNLEAILDAADDLLESGRQPSISAVASQAGVSRVTVYAHFRDLDQLIEALVERAVRRAEVSIEAAEPGRGPADDALRRVIEVSWDELGRHHAIAHAAASDLSSAAIHRSHESVARQIRRLVDRGRKERVFRTDVSAAWLVASYFALVHAARDEVLAGRTDRQKALRDLTPTLLSLFTGDPPRRRKSPSGLSRP